MASEIDSVIEMDDIEEIRNKIEALNKQRGPTLVDRRTTINRSGSAKYQSFEKMSDVVDELLTRSGVTLQEISRLNVETYIDSAQRSAYGTLQKVNDYRVVAEIARGTFGIVFLVEDDRRRRYAMKSFAQAKVKSRALTRGRPGMKANAGNEELEVIRKEIALMKRLSHPNIVKLYEVRYIIVNSPDNLSLCVVSFGQIVEEQIYPHSIYMIMEYITGGPIMSIRDPSLPPLARRQSSNADSDGSSAQALSPLPFLCPQYESPITGGVLGEALASRLFRYYYYIYCFL
jgi:hypothetical protein